MGEASERSLGGVRISLSGLAMGRPEASNQSVAPLTVVVNGATIRPDKVVS